MTEEDRLAEEALRQAIDNLKAVEQQRKSDAIIFRIALVVAVTFVAIASCCSIYNSLFR